jgi:hypothetical protein
MSDTDTDIRSAVTEFSGWFAIDPYDDETLHIRKPDSLTHLACGDRFHARNFFPIITLNEGRYSWCNECAETAIEATESGDE